MTQVLLRLLTALLMGLGFGGCTPQDAHPPEDPGLPASRIGTPLVSWGEGQFPDIRDNPELPLGPVLITSEAQREALLSSQPLGPDLSAVAAVDLSENVLVVAGYSSCTEQGAVWSDGVTVWWDARPPASDEHVLCVWSPFRVDITAVPLTAFGDDVALVTPPWDR